MDGDDHRYHHIGDFMRRPHQTYDADVVGSVNVYFVGALCRCCAPTTTLPGWCGWLSTHLRKRYTPSSRTVQTYTFSNRWYNDTPKRVCEASKRETGNSHVAKSCKIFLQFVVGRFKLACHEADGLSDIQDASTGPRASVRGHSQCLQTATSRR